MRFLFHREAPVPTTSYNDKFTPSLDSTDVHTLRQVTPTHNTTVA